MNTKKNTPVTFNPKQILDALPTGVTVQDTDGHVVYVNKTAAALIGYSAPNPVAKNASDKIMNNFTLLTEDGNPLPANELPGRRVLISKQEEESIVRFRQLHDKKDYWSMVRAAPLLDTDGSLLGVVNSFQDVTKIKKSENAIKLLNKFSTLLSASVTSRERVAKLLEFVIPTIADFCSINMKVNGSLTNVALHHVDPNKLKLARIVEKWYTSPENTVFSAWSVLKSGKMAFFPEINREDIETSITDKKIVKALRTLSFHSAAIIPIKSRGQIIGTIVFARTENNAPYDHEYSIFLQNLANKFALLVDNSRLFDMAQHTIALQHEIQEKLEKSHETLRLALSTGHMAVWDWDLATSKITLSDGLESLYGLPGNPADTVEELLAYIHPDDLPRFLRKVETAIEEKGSYHVEYRIVRPDKSTHWIHSQGRVLKDKNGQPNRIIGIGMDITDRKTAEEAVRENEKKFYLIFETALDSIVLLDNKMRIADANPSASILFTRTTHELIGKKFTDLLLPDEKTNFKKQWQSLMKKGELNGEISIRKTNSKTRSIEYNATARYVRDRHLFVIRDISDRREEENRREHLLGIASHELRTPLASIKAYTHILTRLAQKKSATDPIQYLSKIDEKADILAKIINDLLDVARIKQEKFELVYEIVDFDTLVKNTIQDLQLAIPTHKIIRKGKTKTDLIVDKNRIVQVLSNLIKNASKYSPEGTDISIESTRLDKKVTVTVTDQGTGIPKSDQTKIFNLYYRGKPAKHSEPSLGVGLFIASEIIKQHGGTLSIQSKVGLGSTFTITLPVRSFE